MSEAEHTLPLCGDWSLWRWFCVRSAGFPASLVERVATPSAAAAANALLALEAARERACALAEDELKAELTQQPGERRKPIARRLKQLAARQSGDEPPANPALAVAQQTIREAERALREFEQDWQQHTAGAHDALREIACEPEFRQALLWQNRRALHTGVASLLRQPRGASDFKARQNEALIASYVQRYALKNESIGFFGPVVWGELERQGPALAPRPGAQLVAAREVFFEYWCIDALASEFSRSAALRRELSPRLLPGMRLEHGTLHYPIARRRELPEPLWRLLEHCDGRRSAQQIAEHLSSDPQLGFETTEQVYAALESLSERRVISWQLEISPAVPHPERQLRAELLALPDHAERARALGELDELDAQRSALTIAAGDCSALDQGLSALERAFTRVTGRAAQRNEGTIYAGRSLAYEDCRRDLSLSIGPALRARLGAPLALILDSARWYSHEIARSYRARFDAEYRALRDETGRSSLDFLQFHARCSRHLARDQHEPSATVRAAAEALAAGWADVLRCDPELKRAQFESAKLAPRVAARFAAPGPGWPTARYHCPDVLVAARDVAAAERGELLLVLGELHAGMNTLLAPVFAAQHPDEAALQRALDRDLSEPRTHQVAPKQHATRLYPHLLGSQDFEFELGETRSVRERVLRASELVVDDADSGLIVRTRDGSYSADVIAFMEDYLLFDSMAHFRLLPTRTHTPRITIDQLVVARESWRLERSALAFAELDTPARRFLGMRRLQERLGLPRHVFFKLPEERKPYGVDLDSAPLVEAFARLARKASAVTISEMLPAPGEFWLSDARGQRYASELRFVARDSHRFTIQSRRHAS